MTAPLDCPLPACDWTYTPAALPADTERELGGHFAEHTTREWVSGLRAQQDALSRILDAWDEGGRTGGGDANDFLNAFNAFVAAIDAAREWVGRDT